jgi:co-chaperonin GroES (HSP10)
MHITQNADPSLPDQHTVMPSDMAAWKWVYVQGGQLRAVGERIIVRPFKVNRTLDSGLVLPDNAEWDLRSSVGTVVSIGLQHSNVSVDDVVLFHPWGGTEIYVAEEVFIVLSNDDLFAILE